MSRDLTLAFHFNRRLCKERKNCFGSTQPARLMRTVRNTQYSSWHPAAATSTNMSRELSSDQNIPAGKVADKIMDRNAVVFLYLRPSGGFHDSRWHRRCNRAHNMPQSLSSLCCTRALAASRFAKASASALLTGLPLLGSLLAVCMHRFH